MAVFTTIQNIILDIKNDNNYPRELYCHSSDARGESVAVVSELSFGDSVTFDGFTNVLSIDDFTEKLGLQTVCLRYKARGVFLLTIHNKYDDSSSTVVFSKVVNSTGNLDEITLDFSGRKGLIYLTVLCLDPNGCYFDFFKWGTYVLPRRDVKLSLVVCHFNRHEEVAKTIRIFRELENKFEQTNKLSLVIVDNSSNLNLTNLGENIFILPNDNLGGAGGFTRGLLYSNEKLQSSHVLFLDDDALSSEESIYRTYRYFQFFVNECAAISGTLLKEEDKLVIHERGGYYAHGQFYPINCGWSIEGSNALCALNRSENLPNYGAWCYFAFPLISIQKLPFPFFIHGDDVLFSISNRLQIETPFGIFAYIDDFLGKESPFRVFLDTRNYLFINTLIGESWKVLFARYLKPYLGYLFSYQYDNLFCMRQGLKESLMTSHEWGSVNRLFENKAQIDSVCKQCVLRNVELDNVDNLEINLNKNQSLFRRLWASITLYGNLMFHKEGVMLVNIGSNEWKDGFFFKSFLFYHKGSHSGYIVHHSFFKFIQFSILLVADLFILFKLFFLRKDSVTKVFDDYALGQGWHRVYSKVEK